MTVNRRTLIGTVCAISVFGVPLISSAQTGTRSNPIKIVVPYPPGGPLDVSARAIAEAVHADLGNVIVDNRPGAGGNRGVTYLAQQKPDGMTLCVGAVATHAVNPNLFKKLPYDPIKDFEAIRTAARERYTKRSAASIDSPIAANRARNEAAGTYFLMRRDYPTARELFLEALRHAPSRPALHQRLFETERQSGNRDQAQYHLRRMLELFPSNPKYQAIYRENAAP